MRTLCWWSLVGAAALALVGCSGNAPTSPTGQAGSNDLFDVYASETGDMVESISGHYRVNIDLATLTGTAIDLNRSRNGAAQGDMSYLEVNGFFTAGPLFDLVSLGLDVNGNVQMTYSVTHPFAAPTALTPPSNAATKRADLGASGYMLFLADVPAGLQPLNTAALYEGDYEFDLDGTAGAETIANTRVVKNADGYYDPAGTEDTSFPGPYTATVFPFKVVVDESADPRTDSATGLPIANNIGTVPSGSGNFNVGTTAGWQQANMGANRNGWTGYGFLHQGQTVENTVTFDPDEALDQSFSLDLLFIAKYHQPKGPAIPPDTKQRLPASPEAQASFAYFGPYGALDIEKITATDDNGSGTDLGTAALATEAWTLAIIDQDMTATVTAGFTDVSAIPQASGIAEVNAASGEMGFQNLDAAPAPAGSGTFDDPGTYALTVENTAGGTGGIDNGAMVMVQCIDEEDGVATFNTLKGNPPGPAATPVRPVTYQAFFVEIS